MSISWLYRTKWNSSDKIFWPPEKLSIVWDGQCGRHPSTETLGGILSFFEGGRRACFCQKQGHLNTEPAASHPVRPTLPRVTPQSQRWWGHRRVEMGAAQSPVLCCFYPPLAKWGSAKGRGRDYVRKNLFIFPIWLAHQLHERCGPGLSGRGRWAPHPLAFVLNWKKTLIFWGISDKVCVLGLVIMTHVLDPVKNSRSQTERKKQVYGERLDRNGESKRGDWTWNGFSFAMLLSWQWAHHTSAADIYVCP